MTTLKVDDGRSLNTRVGEEVTLEVPGANTTGHLWELKTDPGAVEIESHQLVPDDQNFGGSGLERFVVKPLKEGISTLTFELRAPWETQAAETRSIRMQVQE